MTEDVLLLATLVLLPLDVAVERDHVAASIILLLLKDISLGICLSELQAVGMSVQFSLINQLCFITGLSHHRRDDTRRRGLTLVHHHVMAQGLAVGVMRRRRKATAGAGAQEEA